MHSTIFLGPAMKVSSSLQKPNCNLDMSEVRWFVSIKKSDFRPKLNPWFDPMYYTSWKAMDHIFILVYIGIVNIILLNSFKPFDSLWYRILPSSWHCVLCRFSRDFAIGHRIGFYKIKGDLGSGNFSRVRLASHELTQGATISPALSLPSIILCAIFPT